MPPYRAIEEQLLKSTIELVEIDSVSGDEMAICDFVQTQLSPKVVELEHLGATMSRVGNNLIFRVPKSRGLRVAIAGHLDTVPPSEGSPSFLREGRLYGLGSSDMKGGLAVMMALADLKELEVDLTLIFYACEEVALERNGLREVFTTMETVKEVDVAILMEPTANFLEAGCQGTLRVRIDLRGVRAHTARPWVGKNAISKLGSLLEDLKRFPIRKPIIDAVSYREALSPVRVEGGVANNVVPDLVSIWVNYRFAPDIDGSEALSRLSSYLRECGSFEDGDQIVVEDLADGALPNLNVALISRLAAMSKGTRAKLGWTDVAFFSQFGIPAANFGPGDPLLAHSSGEWLQTSQLLEAYDILRQLLVTPE